MSNAGEFEDIATAQFVNAGTVADLKMPCGRIVRAMWGARGLVTAWWPLSRADRLAGAIGLYDPVEWRRVSGVSTSPSTPAARA